MTKNGKKNEKRRRALRRLTPAIAGTAGFSAGTVLCFLLRDEIVSGFAGISLPKTYGDPAALFDALGRQLVFFVLTGLSALSMYALVFPSLLLFLRAAEAAFASLAVIFSGAPAYFAVLQTLTGVGISLLLCASAHLSDCFYRKVPRKNARMIADYTLRQLYLVGCASVLFLLRAALLTFG